LTRTLAILPLAILAACQTMAPEVEVEDSVRLLTNACLAEQGLPVLPERVTEAATIELTEAQQTEFAACVERRS
jgi:hypothetical protein